MPTMSELHRHFGCTNHDVFGTGRPVGAITKLLIEARAIPEDVSDGAVVIKTIQAMGCGF